MKHALVVVLGLLVSGVGILAGTLPLSGVEPADASYIGCGAAVFGRPDPLPHATCADAYAPLPAVTWAFIAAGILLVAALWSARRPSHIPLG